MTAADGEVFADRVDVLEVRRCRNGFVVTVWWQNPLDDSRPGRGYATHVVEDTSPEKVGAAVTEVLKSQPMDLGAFIPAARKLP